jgi:heme-degrading monooxygenase HmoA
MEWYRRGITEGVDERPLLTVFRSRMKDEDRAEFDATAARMHELARAMPGFVEYRRSRPRTASGSRSLSFDSAEHQAAWRHHPEHALAQGQGRAEFYASYELSVCEVVRRSRFP